MLTEHQVKRVLEAIAECDRLIEKESARDPALRPPEVARLLAFQIAHREKLIAMIAAEEVKPMKYLIEVRTGNAAFDPEPGPELARILRRLADRIETASPDELTDSIRLMDYNGNAVGTARLAEGGES